ncbi:MAG: hypothetical protein ACOCVF_01030 [bacterium]
MKELKIYDYQAEQIENTLRLINNFMNASDKSTSLKRDVMQSWKMIENVINNKPDKQVLR